VQKTHSGTVRRLPLEEIQAFVEVAMAGSFSAGADRLSLSHSSLSRKVAHLESRLGVRLFDRKAHGVQLTLDGAAHFLRFRDGLDLIGSAMRDTPTNEPGVVRISLLQSFAVQWLFPRHRRLTERTGGIMVRYLLDRRTTDFADGTDLAVRFGMGNWSGIRAIDLGEENVRPMAVPDIAGVLGEDPDPSALLDYPLVHLGTETAWRAWFDAHGVTYRLRPFDHVFEEQPIVAAAVANGLGIGLSRPASRDLVDGVRLAHVARRSVPLQSRYHLVRDASRPLRSAARAYAEALLIEAGAEAPRIHAFLS
jgi:DNA-binding transcriptional LysR family regulator